MGYSTVVFDTIWVFTLAWVYALIEIEMEGKYGWAKNLPTAKNVLGQFTLYHVYMLIFVGLMFSGWFFSRFVSGCDSGWNMVCHFFFFTLLWLLVEDFLWFVFNPYYTLKNYCKQKIPWHKHWIGNRVPVHNVAGVLGLAALAVANWNGDLWISLGVSALFLIFCAFVAPAYHRFYVSTHRLTT